MTELSENIHELLGFDTNEVTLLTSTSIQARCMCMFGHGTALTDSQCNSNSGARRHKTS